MQLDLRVEVVVCAAREPYRGGRVGLDLHAGARLRKNEKIDAGFIHRRDAAIAEIFKQSLECGARLRIGDEFERPLQILLEPRRGKGFFERDLSQGIRALSLSVSDGARVRISSSENLPYKRAGAQRLALRSQGLEDQCSFTSRFRCRCRGRFRRRWASALLADREPHEGRP